MAEKRFELIKDSRRDTYWFRISAEEIDHHNTREMAVEWLGEYFQLLLSSLTLRLPEWRSVTILDSDALNERGPLLNGQGIKKSRMVLYIVEPPTSALTL